MQEKRLKQILNASIVAICVNVALGIFKAVVGLLSNSVAITMDAINNFTDAASSLITIVATYFSSKAADKKHPFGYGRTEYLGTLLIGGLISYAGVTAFIESVKKIITPEAAEYSNISLIIITIAVFVKIGLAMFITNVGKKTNSDSLIASGKEAIGDIAISIATVVAALLYIFANISLEAWLGAVIAAIIIKAGVETLKDTIDKILGAPVEAELVKNIKSEIVKQEGVKGAYDLVLHNYGPDSYMASLHIAVEDTLSVNKIDEMTRKIQKDIYQKFNVIITAIGLYSISTLDEATIQLREEINKLALKNEYVHNMHGFYLDKTNKEMRFDLVISFDSKDRHKTYEEVSSEIRKRYPEYNIEIGMDVDFNEV